MREKKLQLRRERLTELSPSELADVKGANNTQLCNCTGTSHMPTQLECLLTLKNCIA
jgi:hypothetical protein